MPTALNMTLPLKQDDVARHQLQELKDRFATHIQPAIEAALRESQTVHFARVLIIEDKYIQVLTEFDGSKEDYTEFFRIKLQGVFKAIFSLVQDAPSWDELNNQDDFYKFSRKFQVRALGASTRGELDEGYLFSAFGEATVREIRSALEIRAAARDPQDSSSFVSGWPLPRDDMFAMHHPSAMAMHHPSAMMSRGTDPSAMHHPSAMTMHHPSAMAMHHPSAMMSRGTDPSAIYHPSITGYPSYQLSYPAYYMSYPASPYRYW